MVKPATRWVGLDLGSAAVKLAVLESRPDGVHVVSSLIQELPGAEGALAAALKVLPSPDVHLAIGGPDVALRRVTVPPMSRAELAEAVKWQVKEELPFPVQDAVLDFAVVGDVWDKDIRKLDVLVAAASRQAVEDAVARVERAGARVASVLPVHLALAHLLRRCEPAPGAVAIVEVGAGQTHLVVVKDGQPRIARDIPIGSAHFTRALVGVMVSEHGEVSLNLEQAEAIKRRYGVLAGVVEGVTEQGISLAQLSALMRSVLENLLVELARFLDFYKMQVDPAGIAEVQVCGGGSHLKGLDAFFSEGLGVPVRILNPLDRLAPDPSTRAPASAGGPSLGMSPAVGRGVVPSERSESRDDTSGAPGLPGGLHGGSVRAEEGPALAVAIGAALAHGQALDLMPKAHKRARRRTETARWARRLASIGGGLALAGLLALHALAVQQGRRLRVQERAWERMGAAYGRSLAVASELARVEALAAAVTAFRDAQPVWEGVFKELGRIIPAGVTLTDLAIAPPDAPSETFQVRKRGVAAASEANQPLTAGAARSELGQLLDAVEGSPFFRGVELVGSQVQAGTAGTSFEIACRLE